jgi:hypothetical protein
VLMAERLTQTSAKRKAVMGGDAGHFCRSRSGIVGCLPWPRPTVAATAPRFAVTPAVAGTGGRPRNRAGYLRAGAVATVLCRNRRGVSPM